MPRVAVKDEAKGKGGVGQGWRKGTSRMLSFTVARAIVRKLKLESKKEWEAWRKAGHRPTNIPTGPDRVYRDDGWISYPDWLGYVGVVPGKMLSFAAARAVARAVVRKVKLTSQKEWKAWSKSGERPSNIPSDPQQSYRDNGWISMPDWLGYGSEEGASGSGSSSSSSSSATQKKTKKKKTKKTVAPQPHPPPPRGNTNGGPSRKRARAASGSESDSDDDTLGSSSSGPPQTKVKVEVEEIGGFSIVSSAHPHPE